jgi:tetratricopeptide (TPR) repeat protein
MSEQQNGLYEAGLEALERADFDEAIALFEQAVVTEPESSKAWFQLGVCYLETGHGDEALEALARALHCDPEFADAHYLLGTALGSSGQLDRAAECYRRALAIDPHHAKAEEFLLKTMALIESRGHYRLGMQHVHAPDRAPNWVTLALREFVQSVAIFPQSPARHDLARCVQAILQALAQDPAWERVEDADPIWAAPCRQGHQYLKRGDWDGAVDAYREALRYRDTDAFVYHALGIALFQSRDVDGAVKSWLHVMDLDPDYDFTTLK